MRQLAGGSPPNAIARGRGHSAGSTANCGRSRVLRPGQDTPKRLANCPHGWPTAWCATRPCTRSYGPIPACPILMRRAAYGSHPDGRSALAMSMTFPRKRLVRDFTSRLCGDALALLTGHGVRAKGYSDHPHFRESLGLAPGPGPTSWCPSGRPRNAAPVAACRLRRDRTSP
jgi:hypothetical protein